MAYHSQRGLSEKLRAGDTSAGTAVLLTARAVYNFATDGGAVSTIVPRVNAILPARSVIVGVTVNSTTAVLSGGASTMSVGTSAGSSTTALLGATAKASMSLNALINGTPTFAVPVKLSAAGSITVTIATAAQTAGVVEVHVLYYVASA